MKHYITNNLPLCALCEVSHKAQIFMKWDNHRSLPIVPGEDSFRKLTAEELAEEQSSGIDATESGPEMQM